MILKSLLQITGKYLRCPLRNFVLGLGIVLIISVVFSFTDYPFWAYYWLGTHNADLEMEPELIVLLGGGGMPSADGLMRCYHAAKVADHHSDAFVVIAVPADTALNEDSPELLMCRELSMRGIDSTRIFYERDGVNTITQAKNLYAMLGPELAQSSGIRLVTSPEHMYRSVAVFRKTGFRYVGGQPSFETDIKEQMLIKKRKKGDETEKDALKALSLRYNMWNYLKYEITVLRELCAIAYYKLRGWI